MSFCNVHRWTRAICVAIGLILFAIPAVASESAKVWQSVDPAILSRAEVESRLRPAAYQVSRVFTARLEETLAGAPLEFSADAARGWAEITLPMPDGSYDRFKFVESPIMAPELAAKYPEFKTYVGQGIDNPADTMRFDRTPAGFHAQILSPDGAVRIDPFGGKDSTLHMSYYLRDRGLPAGPWSDEVLPNPNLVRSRGGGPRTGEWLLKYRLACAATAEYTIYHGGTVELGLAAIVTAINRVTGIYENDFAIRLELVADNDLIVYTDPGSDPYTNNDGDAILEENQTNLDAVIGSANYDMGHVFSTNEGGLSYLGIVCEDGWKAKAMTGTPTPTGDPFWVDYVAHEMGHQFGGNHTFNSETGACVERNASTAYEPGSGSTIMAYAGICWDDDLQLNSDPYFHFASIIEIRDYVDNGGGFSCPQETWTGNTDPTVDAGDTYTIPQSTPFVLTATGDDVDGDTITYCWEQRDLGPAASLSTPDDGAIPLFRSWNPTTDPSRTFPRLEDLVQNSFALGEQLPTTNRTMNFRCTVRDNRAGGGGTAYDDMHVTVHATAGPFQVTTPNSGAEVWYGPTELVGWDVADTDTAPVGTANVNILLSIDGGYTYPYTLATNTPNDGSESVAIPGGLLTGSARVKVEAVGNVFFDISNFDFTVDTGGDAACCYGYPEYSCDDLTSVECAALGGVVHGGEACATFTCVEPWCAASSSSCDYAHIGRVEVGTIDNNTDCTPGGYADYTAMSTDMLIDSSYPITVTDGPPSYVGDQCGIWVDWNHNYVFTDPGEQVTVTNTGVGVFNATITPPTGTPTGATRMRVRIKWTGDLSPCGEEDYGEMEEYTINVIGLNGACCVLDGTCSVETEADCLANNGTYQGDGTSCDLSPCKPDVAAFVNCLQGPDVSVSGECIPADLDNDTDVDLQDFVEFQQLY